jgi:hypothetical protein
MTRSGKLRALCNHSLSFRRLARHFFALVLRVTPVARQSDIGQRNLGHRNKREALGSSFLCPPFLCHSSSDRTTQAQRPRPAGSVDGNRSAMAGFAAAHG